MASNSTYTVRWHYETAGKKAAQYGECKVGHYILSDTSYNTAVAALNSNGQTAPSGCVIVIDGISNSGAGTYLS